MDRMVKGIEPFHRNAGRLPARLAAVMGDLVDAGCILLELFLLEFFSLEFFFLGLFLVGRALGPS